MNNKFYFEYITKYGDSIDLISQKNGLDSDFLIKYNPELEKNNISAGKKVKVPIVLKDDILDLKYFGYISQNNETLTEVALKFDIPLNTLYDFNNINKECKKYDGMLKIPYSEKFYRENNNQNIIYAVKKEDTINSIASEYGLESQELLNYNRIIDDKIYEGMNLKIPIISNIPKNYFEYIVRNDDKLENIAKNYGYEVSDLMSYNNLSSNLLTPGMIIKIPTK